MPPGRTPPRQLLLARGDGGVLSALSVARRRGVQQGVAWFCGSLDMRLRGFPVRGPRDGQLGKAGGAAVLEPQRPWLALLELYYETFHAQSQPISSQAYLLQGMEELKQRYPDKDTVPLPDDRLHDRRLFTRTAPGWSFCTLVP
jgi:hypothetical protein